MATSMATGLASFIGFRFALGLGEAGNWPGATKAVSEWFPRRESGWAVALFDSGSSIGGALAPFIVLWVYHLFDSWRPAFLDHRIARLHLADRVPLAVPAQPEQHAAALSRREERARSIRPLRARDQRGATVDGKRLASYRRVFLRLPQTWGYILGKPSPIPVWFFITDWFAIFLVRAGLQGRGEPRGLLGAVPRGRSGQLLRRRLFELADHAGLERRAGRKSIAVIGGLGMMLLDPSGVDLLVLRAIVTCFAISTFAYAAFSTIMLNLPADLFPSGSVAIVSGLGGTGAGIGTITRPDRSGMSPTTTRSPRS